MKREEITGMLETRRNAVEDDEITVGHDYDIYFAEGDDGNGETGTLSIEYKPDDLRLAEDGLATLVERDYFRNADSAEVIVKEVYWALVDLLFPGSAYLDEPWEKLPLVVSLEYGTKDHEDFYVSLGSYR